MEDFTSPFSMPYSDSTQSTRSDSAETEQFAPLPDLFEAHLPGDGYFFDPSSTTQDGVPFDPYSLLQDTLNSSDSGSNQRGSKKRKTRDQSVSDVPNDVKTKKARTCVSFFGIDSFGLLFLHAWWHRLVARTYDRFSHMFRATTLGIFYIYDMMTNEIYYRQVFLSTKKTEKPPNESRDDRSLLHLSGLKRFADAKTSKITETILKEFGFGAQKDYANLLVTEGRMSWVTTEEHKWRYYFRNPKRTSFECGLLSLELGELPPAKFVVNDTDSVTSMQYPQMKHHQKSEISFFVASPQYLNRNSIDPKATVALTSGMSKLLENLRDPRLDKNLYKFSTKIHGLVVTFTLLVDDKQKTALERIFGPVIEMNAQNNPDLENELTRSRDRRLPQQIYKFVQFLPSATFMISILADEQQRDAVLRMFSGGTLYELNQIAATAHRRSSSWTLRDVTGICVLLMFLQVLWWVACFLWKKLPKLILHEKQE